MMNGESTLTSAPRVPGTLVADLSAGLAVFLVALPLCLGIALSSNAPLFAGVLAGIVGGVVVGIVSGSHTSVSGPAAGLTAVVAAQIGALGSFDTFLMALVIAGILQIILGAARAGFLADFIPTSVINGLLAAIGLLIILKQIPHLLGNDSDPAGEMRFLQPDQETTISELGRVPRNFHAGAALIGGLSIAFLLLWDRSKTLKKSFIPGPLMAVLVGVLTTIVLDQFGEAWAIGASHLVQVPVAENVAGFIGFLKLPAFSQLSNPAVYTSGAIIAAVASLETMLSLEAVDKIDPRQRTSPPNRELLAQGMGNMVSGLIGGLPLTSVIVRSSVNINAGARTKLAAVIHGLLLLISVILIPKWLNTIPLSCLAAILIVTGFKLASPVLVRKMWSDGKYQFIPFAVTVIAIIFTDLLVGILIGLAVSLSFILSSNIRHPVRRFVEKHLGGDVVHIVFPNQVSFLNRSALHSALDEVPPGGHVLLDAQETDYIDPDVLELVRSFAEKTGPAREIEVSRIGFRRKYDLGDQIQYVDYSTRDLQQTITPAQVLELLMEGHKRFQSGRRLTRDLGRLVSATAAGQHPLAVIVSCIDSRTPAELIFDLGVGDVFSVRVAGNVVSSEVLGSVEYGCAVAGAKLVVLMGHTRCGAVTAAVDLHGSAKGIAEATSCQNLECIVLEIQRSIAPGERVENLAGPEREAFVNGVARRNILRGLEVMRQQSRTLDSLLRDGKIAFEGALYDVATGSIEFLEPSSNSR